MRGREWNPRKRITVRTPASTPKRRVRELARKKVDKLLIHLTADVRPDNRVVIKCTRVSRLTVQLHPSLVDFSKKVRVVVNGRTVFYGSVKPTPLTLLNSAAEGFDFQRLPHASVTVPVR